MSIFFLLFLCKISVYFINGFRDLVFLLVVVLVKVVCWIVCVVMGVLFYLWFINYCVLGYV